MKNYLRLAACVIGLVALASAAQATVACAVVSSVSGARGADMVSEPGEGSDVIREIPLGDLVLFPQQDLSPTEAEGWVWVQHDITQEDIWQSGIFGWMREENLSDCG